jgi:NitT/TauT family transport system permease protein/putative hydroxymethylpyrimidine transport system permease protein
MKRAGWVAVLILLIVAWQAYVRLRGVPGYLLPAPTDVLRTFWDDRSTLLSESWVTGKEMIVGYIAAIELGLAFATAMHFSETLRRAVSPLLVASQSIPVVAIAPVVVIYLGFGLVPKIILIALVCFFPIAVNALDGFRSVDPEYGRMMRTLYAGRKTIFWRVEAPWALPNIFSGCRIAAPYAAIGALFAEYAGGSGGLADSLRGAQLDTALVAAGALALTLLALALTGIVVVLERVFVPWAHEAQ